MTESSKKPKLDSYTSVVKELSERDLQYFANGIHATLTAIQCTAILRVLSRKIIKKFEPPYLSFGLVRRIFFKFERRAVFDSPLGIQVQEYLDSPVIAKFLATFREVPSRGVPGKLQMDTLLQRIIRTNKVSKTKLQVAQEAYKDVKESSFVADLLEEYSEQVFGCHDDDDEEEDLEELLRRAAEDSSDSESETCSDSDSDDESDSDSDSDSETDSDSDSDDDDESDSDDDDESDSESDSDSNDESDSDTESDSDDD